MSDGKILLSSLEKLHTTEMGKERIIKNLCLPKEYDAVLFCKEKIQGENCSIYKSGKNFYCETQDIKITVNSHSYTIITAHLISSKGCGDTNGT